MSLSDRIARQKCAVVGCDRQRIPDGYTCRDCLGDLWANRLHRNPDGTLSPVRRFVARDETMRGMA